MNIGDKVQVTTSCGMASGVYNEGIYTVNTRNANALDDLVRVGFAKILSEAELPKDNFRKDTPKNASAPILPDSPEPKKLGRRVIVKAE